MATVDEFSRLVSDIYAAADTPEHWEPAIREIHRALGGTGGSLLVGDPRGVSFQNSTLPVEALQTYRELDYYRLDYVLAAVENGPVGAVRTGPEVIAPNRNPDFYHGWMRPNELEDGLFVRLTGEVQPTCFLVMSARQSFDTPERVKLMGALVPHLQQALRTQSRLTALANRSVELADALNVVRHGVVIVGSDCWVLDLNSAAEAILRTDDGVHVYAGRIGATNMSTERRLYRALQAALVGDDSDIRSGRSFICARPSGKRPYVVHVLPLHQGGSRELARDSTALVLIIDPEQEPEPPEALLRRLFGLTGTEAEVAVRIVRGADVKEVAQELSVSLATVRTHLQHVFDKTDTHRQSELVRRLLTLSP